MRVIGHMVTRNEMGRWLTSTLPWLTEICHGNVAIYDDQSDDDIRQYVDSLGLHFERRPQGVHSFAENEGIFRWAGWQFMERSLAPRPGDWILTVDADELLLTAVAGGDVDLVRLQLLEAIGAAEDARQRSVTFRVAEVFSFDGMGWPLIRTDGFWGEITACRLAKWVPQAVFDHREEGGGSIPSNWPRATTPDLDLELLHLGYARPEDRVAKHRRYRKSTGHNRRHIDSILDRPNLKHWVGMRPPLR